MYYLKYVSAKEPYSLPTSCAVDNVPVDLVAKTAVLP